MPGCGNHNCIIEKPKGMGTNGRCRCLDGLPTAKRIEVERLIQGLRDALEQLADDKGRAYWAPEEVRQIARTALKMED